MWGYEDELIITIIFFSPAVGIEINILFSYWDGKLKEIQEKFKKLYDDMSPPQSKKKVKQRKEKKKDLETISSDDIRKFAAELMIELYYKVTFFPCM
jgi:NACalpha-BTF3-like transcription factor